LTWTGRPKKIGITRIHLEEDAGKTIHSQSTNQSFVDLNRGGVPLAEIVSEPDISSPAEAVAYLKSLHNIVLYLGVSDGNMEEGNFRCDVNISIRPKGSTQLGTRTELKNINSFRNIQRALEYEIERHKEVVEEGGSIVQETRLYDANKNATFPMRSKEEAHDYRYCPDPDLVPVYLDDKMLTVWREELPELPAGRLQRFINDWGLPFEDAAQITGERPWQITMKKHLPCSTIPNASPIWFWASFCAS
jgi:aspartyl/glutamyl-tRNA(Asn/Gln) amidotransferase subunit B (EC 6.3.5.-)